MDASATAASSPTLSGGGAGGGDEVRTLFISGLPSDIKEREIYNLFRGHAGYESCQLKYTGRGYQIVAFAVFSDQASALAAKESLNGQKFDPELDSTLHIELAKANSRAKRPHSDDRGPSALEKKFRGSLGVSGGYPDTGMVHSVYSDLHGYPPSQSLVGGYTIPDGVSGMMMGSSMSPHSSPGSNPPCSTLFFANLGLSCTETELIHALGRFPGFKKLKMQTKSGLPVAFVEFQDTICSTQALHQLQNTMLPSSVQGGIRIEYARARMGQPGRDRMQQAARYGHPVL